MAIVFLTSSVDAQAGPHLVGLAHVAFRVSDLDRSALFYGNFLGYQQPFSLNNGTGLPPTGFVKVNDLQYLELFPGHSQNQGQLDHFALYTDDLTSMRIYLQSLGMYIAKDIHKGRIGDPFLTIRDPDGHLVEIVQYASNSLTGLSKGKFMPINRVSDHITHVGIVVSSEESAVKFYRALGFREFLRGGDTDGRSRWIDMQVPNGTDYIELILTTGTVAEPKPQNHIGFASSDVRKTVALLQARSTNRLLNSITVQTGGGLPPRTNIFDPDGARIEIMEPIRTLSLAVENPALSK